VIRVDTGFSGKIMRQQKQWARLYNRRRGAASVRRFRYLGMIRKKACSAAGAERAPALRKRIVQRQSARRCAD